MFGAGLILGLGIGCTSCCNNQHNRCQCHRGNQRNYSNYGCYESYRYQCGCRSSSYGNCGCRCGRRY